MAWPDGRAVLMLSAVVLPFLPLAALAQEEEETDPDGYRQANVSSCPFDPRERGKLERVSDVIQGANMSSGTESFALLLDGQVVLSLEQEGPVEGGGGNRVPDPYEIDCERGRVIIHASDETVELRYRKGELSFDRAWARTLQRGAKERTAKGWESVVGVLRQLEDIDQGPLEAARLSWAEELIRQGGWGRAQALLDEHRGGGKLEKWRAALVSSLESLRNRPPLRMGRPRRIGSLLGEQTLPPHQEPSLFWRESSLCAVQELSARPEMRCFDTRQSRWGPAEPAIDPVAAAGRWTHDYCGHPCMYQDAWSVEVTEGIPEVAGTLVEREIVAFVPNRSLLLYREGSFLTVQPRWGDRKLAEDEVREIVSTTPGTRVAGGGRFLFGADGSLVDAQVPDRQWPAFARTVGRDVWGDWGCTGQVLVSPDQTMAACAAALVQEAKEPPHHQVRPHLSLWVFDLEQAR